MDKLHNRAIGTAGELRVMSELIMKGFNPAKSYLDEGVDIILNNGVKIQVKTAMYKQKNVKGGRCYRIQLRKGHQKGKLKLSRYVDFIIGFVIPENTFFIIPAKLIDGFYCLAFSMNKNMKSKYIKYIDNWEILRKGGE